MKTPDMAALLRIVKEATLMEAGDANLYHFTSTYALRDILKSDRLGNAKGPSLTRDTNHVFLKGAVDCMIVLDGRRLSQQYRLVPHFGDIMDFKGDAYRNHGREAEERTDRPIEPVRPFIKEVVFASNYAQPSITRSIDKMLGGAVPLTVGSFEYGRAWFRHRISAQEFFAQDIL